ncbi:uncharacterized protein LOC119664017, partial [Teleopsis dalmanni]
MKFLFCLTFIAVILISYNSYTTGARVCIISVANCTATNTTTVCGRYGRSNLCARFRNSCAYNTANCNSNVAYTRVSSTYCTGISTGTRRRCYGTFSGSSTGILSSLGISASNTVSPIVIVR